MEYKDSPLQEITLRKYEFPHGLGKRELIKKICLSLGLLQPGDTRDVIVDILFILEEAQLERELLTSVEIRERILQHRNHYKLSDVGTAESNVRRQLRRLREMLLVEKKRNTYRIFENMSLTEIFDSKIQKIFVDDIVKRIREYLSYYDEMYKGGKKYV